MYKEIYLQKYITIFSEAHLFGNLKQEFKYKENMKNLLNYGNINMKIIILTWCPIEQNTTRWRKFESFKYFRIKEREDNHFFQGTDMLP